MPKEVMAAVEYGLDQLVQFRPDNAVSFLVTSMLEHHQIAQKKLAYEKLHVCFKYIH